MKRIKKLASLLLALVMVLAMAFPAMAAEATGKITIKGTDNAPMTGTDENGNEISREFKAYKVLDVKLIGDNGNGEKGYVYTVPSELKEFYAARYQIEVTAGDFDSQISQAIAKEVNEDKAGNVFTFATDVLKAAMDAGIEGVTGAVEGNDYVFNNLPLGYYVVTDTASVSPVSALILDTPDTDIEVNIKADRPNIDKVIDGANDADPDTTEDTKYNNAAIGDKVPYKVTSKVPDMIGYEKYYFVVNDTLSKGLAFNDDVEIKIKGAGTGFVDEDDDVDSMGVAAEGIDIVLEPNEDYSVEITENADGTTGVEIVFKNFIRYQSSVGADITISYSATVNQDAVIGIEGNPNKVTLTYSNNPNVSDNGDPTNPDKPGPNAPVGETPEHETRTYVTAIELTKVNADSEKLDGAKFRLEGDRINVVFVNEEIFEASESGTWYRLKDGTYTETAPTFTVKDDEGNVITPGNEDKYDPTVAEDGTVTYTTYAKVEKVTKETNKEHIVTEGYVKDGVLLFEGLSAGEYEITELVAPNGYNLLTDPIKVTIEFGEPVTGSTDCTWTFNFSGQDDHLNNTTPSNNGFAQITVMNSTGVELPSTGGIGTTIFYVVGGILVIGAGILLVTKKRMNAR